MTLMYKVVSSATAEENKFSLWLVSEPKSELRSPDTKQKSYLLHHGVQIVDVAGSPIKSDESTGSPLLSYKCVWEFIHKWDNRLTCYREVPFQES